MNLHMNLMHQKFIEIIKLVIILILVIIVIYIGTSNDVNK